MGTTEKKKILLIEDDDSIAKAYIEHLRMEGYSVEHSRSGIEGLVKARGLKPDLILLDLILPGMDGMTVMKEIKADSEIAHIPIFVLSNVSTDDKVAGFMEMGGTFYFVKSDHSLEEVADKIREFLE